MHVTMLEERYQRNLGAISPEECETLRHAHVFVAGCGGLGGTALELLARAGVGTLSFADGDVFTTSNLNRQLLCEEALLGSKKVQAAKARITSINSGIDAHAMDCMLDKSNAYFLLDGCQIAVDALDNVPSRRMLQDACKARAIPLVHAAVSGWRAQITVIPPGGDAFTRLYPPHTHITEGGILASTAALAASILASETIKVLLGRKPNLTGKLLMVDLASSVFETIAL